MMWQQHFDDERFPWAYVLSAMVIGLIVEVSMMVFVSELFDIELDW